MIQMPRRNVTRFFIPLIDVLILLFCIFLLMEFNSEEKIGQQSVDVESQSQVAKSVEEAFVNRAKEIQRLEKELQKVEDLRPKIDRVDQYLKRIAELEEANVKDVQDRMYFREINIDRNSGKISFHDAANADDPTMPISIKKDAEALILRHTKEAKGRTVYYYFLFPVPRGKAPSVTQVTEYGNWFDAKGVATNLPKGKKK